MSPTWAGTGGEVAEETGVFDATRSFLNALDTLGDRYIAGTNHGETLAAAMDDFQRALAHRWIEQVCDAIVRDNSDFPTVIRREAGYHSFQPDYDRPRWDYSHPAARAHIGNPDVLGHSHCSFITWALGGQAADLSTVACDGATGVEPMGHPEVPPYIECGVGTIFAQVTDWAWGERSHVFGKLPLFDRHDLTALHQAHDDLVELGYQLGLEAGPGSGGYAPDPLDGTPAIPSIVPRVSSLPRDHSVWWAEWTGLQANAAASGFFASVRPSLENQAGIAGSLANMYSDRAAIIEKGRNDALYWIQWATRSLGRTEWITTDRVGGWKAVQGIGAGITAGWAVKGAAAGSAGGPAGAAAGGSVGAAVGAVVTLVGFLGENLAPNSRTEQQRHDFVDVVTHLDDKIDDLNATLGDLEADYRQAANTLHDRVYGIHSFNLETYDLTQNRPTGAEDPGGGLTAPVSHILNIARDCYSLGELYADLLPKFAGIAEADRHLAGEDGAHTQGDKLVLELRDLLESALKTTSGRYLLAGDQAWQAAEEYAHEDDEIRRDFDTWIKQHNRVELELPQVPFDEEEYAEATDRDGNPGTDDVNDRGFVIPGEGEDHYVIEDEDGKDQIVQGER